GGARGAGKCHRRTARQQRRPAQRRCGSHAGPGKWGYGAMTVTQSEPTTNDTAATGLWDRTEGCRPGVRPATPHGCAAAGTRPRPAGRDQYTISEVAEHTGLSAHTLRWYERIGLMPHVDRTHTGQRRFTNRDLDWLNLVTKLRLTGMPVADMVRYAELVREGD